MSIPATLLVNTVDIEWVGCVNYCAANILYNEHIKPRPKVLTNTLRLKLNSNIENGTGQVKIMRYLRLRTDSQLAVLMKQASPRALFLFSRRRNSLQPMGRR